MVLCYLALGSNLRCPQRQLNRALLHLRKIPRSYLRDQSHIYLSRPLGVRAQPDFLNSVVALETNLPPHKLLHYCKQIEQKHRRVHKRVWGARTLDIDILLFGQLQIETPQLTIPHPELLNRDFVLLPLLELAPKLRLPNGEYLAHYVAKKQRLTSYVIPSMARDLQHKAQYDKSREPSLCSG